MRGIREVVVLLLVGVAATAQDVRFEHVDKSLFAAGGTFVSAWTNYDGDGDPDLLASCSWRRSTAGGKF
jgi:hypothetical protein